MRQYQRRLRVRLRRRLRGPRWRVCSKATRRLASLYCDACTKFLRLNLCHCVMGTKRGAGGIQDGRESTCGALMWNGTRKIFKGGGIFDAAHFKNKGNALPELKTAASLGDQCFPPVDQRMPFFSLLCSICPYVSCFKVNKGVRNKDGTLVFTFGQLLLVAVMINDHKWAV